MNIISKLLSFSLIILSCSTIASTTNYGKIIGIETRSWGMHIQTDFGFTMEGCSAIVGGAYMYDFVYNNDKNSPSASAEISIILAAFAANKDIAFHVYDCNSSRPKVGYILLK